MSHDLMKVICVGAYPAACFRGSEAEKDHRRFLRRLVKQGILRLCDSKGNAIATDSLMNGSSHYADWHVDEQGAQVILQQLQLEMARVEDARRKDQEELEKVAEREKEARRKKAEERKTRNDELKALGQWSHPLYKSLKAAHADGWHKAQGDEYGGQEINLKGHTLVRNTKRAQSRTWWKEHGFEVKTGENPQGTRSIHPGRHVVHDVYREDQVIPAEASRLCIHCHQRLPLHHFYEKERVCLSCWGKADDRRVEEARQKQIKKRVVKETEEYLKETGFLPPSGA